jgi:hypothetical protein
MSKSLRTLSLTLLAVALVATSAIAQTDSQKAFSAIKNLPGTWEGKGRDGHPLQVTFKVVSGGSAVMSEILGDHEMISMISLDGGDKLLLTHYCAVGNQPRMQASISPDGKIITFNFVDATNLSAPDAGHMQRMVLTLLDGNHHTEDWTFIDHGTEMKEFFDLHRKL